MNTELSARYIVAKIKGGTVAELLQLRREIGQELEAIKAAKNDVFNRYPGVHGRFQHSQLDVLDIREQKVCAMFDNVSIFIARAKMRVEA